MQWIFEQHGVKPMLHYLDDFLVIVQTGIGNSTIGLCRRLGIPISVLKTEGPSDIPATSAGMTPDSIPTPFDVGRNVAHHTTSGSI